jgi:hypothetical protein
MALGLLIGPAITTASTAAAHTIRSARYHRVHYRRRSRRYWRYRTVSYRTVIQPVQGDPWSALRNCESGGNYAINTGNGYYGAYQFSATTWRALGYGGLPHEAAPPVQDEAARRLQASSGWGQWPACSHKLGLR